MATQSSSDGPVRSGRSTADDEVATQLQRLYEYVLEDRRPEAVGATERLAQRLDVDLDRPA